MAEKEENCHMLPWEKSDRNARGQQQSTGDRKGFSDKGEGRRHEKYSRDHGKRAEANAGAARAPVPQAAVVGRGNNS